jgi:hypothetical protein
MPRRRKPSEPQAARLFEARKRAAKELPLPEADLRTQHLAALLLAHETAQSALALGDVGAIDQLLKIDAALKACQALSPLPTKVEIEWFDSCSCGKRVPAPEPVCISAPPGTERTSPVVELHDQPATPLAEADESEPVDVSEALESDHGSRSRVFIGKPDPKPEPPKPPHAGGDNREFEEHESNQNSGSCCFVMSTPRSTGYQP